MAIHGYLAVRLLCGREPGAQIGEDVVDALGTDRETHQPG
jgi:hypothetical protein